MRHPDDGFTLIEILVTLAILGVVLGVVVSRGPVHSQGLQARAAAGLLAQTLRAARAQAIERGEDVAVVIDPERRSFAADFGGIHTLSPGTGLTVLPPALNGPHGTRLIRFSPDGSASGGGVVLGNGTRRVRIDVQWLTGQVKVEGVH